MRPDLRERTCHRCRGTGDIEDSLCGECLGNGSVCPCHGRPECLEFDERVAAERAKPTN